MKFACMHYKPFANMNECSEFLVIINANYDIKKLTKFINNNSKQSITLIIQKSAEFVDDSSIDLLLNKLKSYKIKLKLSNPWDANTQIIANKCSELGVPFFYDIIIDSWEVLYNILQSKAAEVYIGNSLAFDIERVAEVVHNAGRELRVYPNVAQSSVPNDCDITSFFIRPESTVLYEPYVDTFEIFITPDVYSLQSIYLIMYANNLKWKGELEQFIIGLKNEIPTYNTGMLDTFSTIRLTCQRRCKQFSNCKMCADLADFARICEENGIGINFGIEKPRKLNEMSKEENVQFKEMLKEACDTHNLPAPIKNKLLQGISSI